MATHNWFKGATLKGEPVQAGRLEGFETVELAANDVRTHFADVRGPNSAASICSIPGIWEPAEGTQVQLHDPERLATVRGISFLFDAAGFSATVWLDDPLTQAA